MSIAQFSIIMYFSVCFQIPNVFVALMWKSEIFPLLSGSYRSNPYRWPCSLFVCPVPLLSGWCRAFVGPVLCLSVQFPSCLVDVEPSLALFFVCLSRPPVYPHLSLVASFLNIHVHFLSSLKCSPSKHDHSYFLFFLLCFVLDLPFLTIEVVIARMVHFSQCSFSFALQELQQCRPTFCFQSRSEFRRARNRTVSSGWR